MVSSADSVSLCNSKFGGSGLAGHLGCVPVALESSVFNRQIDYMILTILLWIDRCPASADRLLHTSSSMRAMTTELWGR
jgi:hypothetical protein